MLLLPARNLAPGNVALVLSPPRTRSLPGAFFMPTVAGHAARRIGVDAASAGFGCWQHLPRWPRRFRMLAASATVAETVSDAGSIRHGG